MAQEYKHYPRMGHPIHNIVPLPLKELLDNQAAAANPEMSRVFFYGIPSLMTSSNNYNMMSDAELQEAFPALMLKEKNVFSKKTSDAKFNNKSDNPLTEEEIAEEARAVQERAMESQRIFGAGYAACSMVKIADHKLKLSDPLFSKAEEARQALNEGNLISVILDIPKSAELEKSNDPNDYDTYLGVVNSRFEKNHANAWVQVPATNPDKKLFAAAMHYGLKTPEQLEAQGVNVQLGAIPRIVQELETNHGQFVNKLRVQTDNPDMGYGPENETVSEKAFEHMLPNSRINNVRIIGNIQESRGSSISA